MFAHVLYVKRQYAPGNVDQLGYEQEIPPMVLPPEAPPEQEQPEALDWELCVPPGAGIRRIQPVGLVEPGLWERAFLGWLAGSLGLELPENWDELSEPATGEAHPRLRETLRDTAPWSGPADIPPGVRVQRAATARGEAVAAARQIRTWLGERIGTPAAATACDGVLVLLPGDRTGIETWYRTLSAYDLPVRATVPIPLCRAPLARWILSLGSLAGWGSGRKRERAALLQVVQAPFWSVKAVTEALLPDEPTETGKKLRGKLIGSLKRLRRPTVDLEGLIAHLEADNEARWTASELLLARGFCVGLAEALADGPDLVERLYKLLSHTHKRVFRLNTAGSIRVKKVDRLRDAWDRLRGLFRELARRERESGGVHPALEGRKSEVALPLLLQASFARAATVDHQEPRQGITLLPSGLYDGRPSEHLIMAGLGEGGFPRVPEVLDEARERWLAWLGHEGDGEAFIGEELERQIRLAAAAMGRCAGEVTLSYSTEGSGTGKVYPGPLLSLLVGGWSERQWRSGAPGVEDVTLQDELPSIFAGVTSFKELASIGLRVQLPETTALPAPIRERAARVAAIPHELASSLAGRRERRPEPPPGEGAPFGPHTGLLGGGVQGTDVFSATALQKYGACPYQYFLSRVLGLEEEEEAGAEPDVMEVGSLVHDVLQRAAHSAIQDSGAWLLSFPEGAGEEVKELIVKDALARFDVHLPALLGQMTQRAPSFSQPLLQRIGERWRQALENWVRGQVREVPTHELDTVDQAVSVQAALDAVKLFVQAEQLVRTLEEVCAAGECKSQKTAGEYSHGRVLTKKRLGQAFAQWKKADDAARPAVWELLRQELRQQRALAEGEVEVAREAERERRRSNLARRVVHAELAFGFDEAIEGCDPASVDGPLELEARGVRFGLHGMIDRVDLDPERGAWAVRDYKSGRKTGEAELTRQLMEGHHLQLTLYALAMDQLVRAGKLPGQFEGTRGVAFGLEFPKQARRVSDTATLLSLDRPCQASLDGEEATWSEVTAAWTAHHVQGIRDGRFLLYPANCPLERPGKAYCDFERVCGYSPLHADRFLPPEGRPEVAPLAEEGEKDKKRKKTAEVLPPDCVLPEQDPAVARLSHDASLQEAQDLTQDVVISAGAGTGKTYSLVIRYLSALASGATLQQILCITFTRRAAAEMAHRVRQALLAPGSPDQAALVSRIKQDRDRYRQILLTLSAAPISTIDSLALRLVREAEIIRAELAGGVATAPIPEAAGPAEVHRLVQQMVIERYLEDLEAGDEDLALLLDNITPGRLLPLLETAVSRCVDGQDLPDGETISRLWWSLSQPLLDRFLTMINGLDLDTWERLLEEALAEAKPANRPSDEGETRVVSALEGARALKGDLSNDRARTWGLVYQVLGCASAKTGESRVGNNELYTWLKANVANLKKEAAPPNTEDSELVKEICKLLEEDRGRADLWAKVAAAAARLIGRWAGELSEGLTARLRMRYEDVERRALEALNDPVIASKLAERLRITHLFLDESQDTSQRQVELVRRLAELCKARYFWVGDVKQSIFRFRNAEVDVFQDLVEAGRSGDAQVVQLTVNRRSSRPLISSINRLFGALLPATRGGEPQDRSSEMKYEPLCWLEERDQDPEEPGIELIAVAGKGWPSVEDEPEQVDEPNDGQEQETRTGPESMELERALVQRIKELVGEGGDLDGQGPTVAVLVHAWWRAERYRDLLLAHGVPCVVQGGRGLLSTPEVDHLMLWLEALVLRAELPLLGILRGAGIGLSDTTLYCLRRGYGIRDDAGEPTGDRVRLRRATLECGFDAELALERWRCAAVVDEVAVRPVLEADAANISRFQALAATFSATCGYGDLAGAVEELLDRAGLWAYWQEQPGGQQRLANIHTFVRYLRELEEGGGAPAELVNTLIQVRDQDDPAAGTLEGDGSTRVCITTYWQAKGREWPVVVLPDIHLTRVRADALGLHSERLVMDRTRKVVRAPSLALTSPLEPFKAETPKLIRTLIDCHRMPAERAELRRLLYVAMTRAKERLVLTGEFDLPEDREATMVQDASGERVRGVTLGQAKNWARTLQVATGLGFDEQGMPRLGQGVWSDRDVELKASASLAARLAPASGDDTVELEILTSAQLIPIAEVGSEPVLREDPSDMRSEVVPEPHRVLGRYPEEIDQRKRPLSAADEGTALHAVMEHWGYGAGRSPDPGMIKELLSSQLLGSGADPQGEAAHVLGIVDSAVEHLPDLVAALSRAAAAGQLFHEVPLRFEDRNGARISGFVDLLYRDEEGWHILDYKAGTEAPTATAPLDSSVLKKHHAQVQCYAEGIEKLTGERPVDYGIWYTSYGLVVCWGE